MTDSGPSSREPPSSFERRWRERFMEFASLREDDAGIAGWSDKGLATRFRFFRRVWTSVPPGASFLDVGCGAGTYARWLDEQGLRVTGIDYSYLTLAKARTRVPAGVALCTADATRLPFRGAQFDGALCFGVLQAVSESGPIARELARVLRQDGTLWIDALNAGGLAARATGLRRRLQGREMHLRYESPRVLTRLLADAGFVDMRVYWLPIAPPRLDALQSAFETTGARALLHGIRPLGSLLSHSFVVHARRGG